MTSLGPVEAWPQSLKTATALLIAAPIPIVMLWGPEGVMIYNDAYSVFAGGRHPDLLGSNVREGWPEVADFNDHVMRIGLAGGTLAYKDQELTLYRSGEPEQVWMDLDYWPVPGENGRPAGVIATVVETTERVLADRQKSAIAERLEMALSAGAGIGTWDWDVPNDRVYADERFARLYGVDPEIARRGAPIAEFFKAIHPDDIGPTQALIANALSTGEVFYAEYRLVQPDGEARWVAAEGRATQSEDGRPLRFPGVTFDITERKRTDGLREAHNRLLELAIQDASMATTLEALLQIVEDYSPSGMVGSILLLDEHGTHLRHGAAPNLPEAYNQAIDGIAIGAGVGSCGTAAHGGQPVYVSDIATDPLWADFKDLALAHGLHACWSIPIRSAPGAVLGAFAMYYREPREPAPADLELVDVVTFTAALIIQRAKAEVALRESEERYRTLFGDSTTGMCIIEMKFDAEQRPIDYMIVEGNAAFEQLTGLVAANGKWVSEVAPGLEQHWFDLYGRVALTGEPARFENPADIFGRWYDVQALRLGQAEDCRVAILFNDITGRKGLELRHQVLLELNDAIRDLTDPAEIAQASARILAEALKVSRVGYGVMDTVAETVTIERDYNAPGVQSIAGVIHFRDFGDYIEDLARGDVVVFDDGGADPRVTDGGAALDSISARALINLPLIEQGQVVALLFVNNATARHWSANDIALVREVAERVRTATERARATVALRRNAERLRFLDALNVEVAKVTGADEVLAVTTRMTAQHLKVANCAYADMDADQDGFTIRGDWAEPGMASIVGHYSLADFGKLAVQELGARRPLIINDNLTEIAPEEAATFQSIGIGATICMPLVKEGRLTALMAVHHRGPHQWTEEELDTIREVTERSWAHVERVRAEAELRESEARFRNMADNTPMMMWVTDPTGYCTYLNKTWYEFTGQTEGEAEGYGWLDVTHPEDKARAEEAFVTANAAKAPFKVEYRLRRADGVYRWAIDAASPRFDANGEYLGYVGSVIDIDERRDAEDALRASEAQLEVLLAGSQAEFERLWELSPDLLTVVNYGGRLERVNPSWTRVLGYDEETLLNRPYVEILHPDEAPAIAELLAEMRANEKPVLLEDRLLAADGSWRSFVWSLSPEPGGERLYGVGRDVTDERAQAEQLAHAQEALRQSQKMEAVGQLTGGIAHDFNNLLAGISGSLELLSKRLSEGRLNGMERYIDAAQGSARRAASLTQRLLAFSRRQTLDPKPTDVNRLINGMDDLIRRSIGPDIELEVVGAGGLWTTQVDPSQLENALLNLCINARDAMAPDGGRLTIETSNKWLDERAARDRELPPGQYVSLCVTDTGTGMTPEIQAQVFDPFFTTKPMGQGTGLGLSMIHGFVRQSGGQVRVYSEVGKGTTMCLYLPRHLGDVDTGEGQQEQPVAEGGHGETVLIIDDEETVRMLVAEVLGDAGYRVIEAPDGPSGLEILRSDRRIDLLISDVGLPGGMNGRQVADAARETRPDLKVLFITGYAENAAVGNGLLAPGMEVLTKPFVMSDLALKVHEMIEA